MFINSENVDIKKTTINTSSEYRFLYMMREEIYV